MSRITLPNPPDPGAYPSPMEWQKAAHGWMQRVKFSVENAINTPALAPFALGTFTAVNTLTGTDATSNFVATLVRAMQAQGVTSPTSQRTTT